MPLLTDITTNIQRRNQKWATTWPRATCWGRDATVPREKFCPVQLGTSASPPVRTSHFTERKTKCKNSLSLIAWHVCLNCPRLHRSQRQTHEGKCCDLQSSAGWVSGGANVAPSLEQVGETWESKCSKCVCDKDTMSVTCRPVKCPRPKPLRCDIGETLVVNKEDCCNMPMCSEWLCFGMVMYFLSLFFEFFVIFLMKVFSG